MSEYPYTRTSTLFRQLRKGLVDRFVDVSTPRVSCVARYEGFPHDAIAEHQVDLQKGPQVGMFYGFDTQRALSRDASDTPMLTRIPVRIYMLMPRGAREKQRERALVLDDLMDDLEYTFDIYNPDGLAPGYFGCKNVSFVEKSVVMVEEIGISGRFVEYDFHKQQVT